ncbi:MAG: hypothetical protein JKX76_02700 [Colwellia sp.]|nr:hypothetical protein [Colwellia sp.]
MDLCLIEELLVSEDTSDHTQTQCSSENFCRENPSGTCSTGTEQLNLKKLQIPSNEQLDIPNASDLSVSTSTAIADAAIHIDTGMFYDNVVITPHVFPIKKRGRRKKNDTSPKTKDYKHGLPDGSIIYVTYTCPINGLREKGCSKKKKKNNEKSKIFRNAVSVNMAIDQKFVNIKIPRTSRIQMTGINKGVDQIKRILGFLFDQFITIGCYTIADQPRQSLEDESKNSDEIPTTINFTLITVMKNLLFNIGFELCRDLLRDNFNTRTNNDFIALPATREGYTGINIKTQYDFPSDMIVSTFEFDITTREYTEGTITYDEYISTLPEKKQRLERTKSRWNTFLVFQTGKSTLSGMHTESMQIAYQKFLQYVTEFRADIEDNST